MISCNVGEYIILRFNKKERRILKNVIKDAEALYDSYPTKDSTETYYMIKDLLKKLEKLEK